MGIQNVKKFMTASERKMKRNQHLILVMYVKEYGKALTQNSIKPQVAMEQIAEMLELSFITVRRYLISKGVYIDRYKFLETSHLTEDDFKEDIYLI